MATAPQTVFAPLARCSMSRKSTLSQPRASQWMRSFCSKVMQSIVRTLAWHAAAAKSRVVPQAAGDGGILLNVDGKVEKALLAGSHSLAAETSEKEINKKQTKTDTLKNSPSPGLVGQCSLEDIVDPGPLALGSRTVLAAGMAIGLTVGVAIGLAVGMSVGMRAIRGIGRPT